MPPEGVWHVVITSQKNSSWEGTEEAHVPIRKRGIYIACTKRERTEDGFWSERPAPGRCQALSSCTWESNQHPRARLEKRKKNGPQTRTWDPLLLHWPNLVHLMKQVGPEGCVVVQGRSRQSSLRHPHRYSWRSLPTGFARFWCRRQVINLPAPSKTNAVPGQPPGPPFITI